MVLIEREKLGFALLELLRSKGIKCEFIYGKTSHKKRAEILQLFEKREIDVLLGGKIVNRGLDLKNGIEYLIIATGGKLKSDFLQKIGRALRHNKRGKSKIIDFLFRCNKYLYNHSKSRLQIMDKAGYKTSIILPNGRLDGKEYINSRFRIPPKLM